MRKDKEWAQANWALALDDNRDALIKTWRPRIEEFLVASKNAQEEREDAAGTNIGSSGVTRDEALWIKQAMSRAGLGGNSWRGLAVKLEQTIAAFDGERELEPGFARVCADPSGLAMRLWPVAK